MTDEYLDPSGAVDKRASSRDFETLESRVRKSFVTLPGFEENQELLKNVTHALNSYERGNYKSALEHLKAASNRMPALEPLISYYVRICNRVLSVLSVQPVREDYRYEFELERLDGTPKFLRWIRGNFRFKVRCKFCGHYTPYVHPDKPTYGIATQENCCEVCRMYPMPSWLWDSPEGRAYGYYRGSFSDGAFYEEFESDFDPVPRRKRRSKREPSGS